MAELSAAETVVANRGELMTVSRSDMLKRFSAAFERFDYQEYIDIRNPVIEISESGDAGWIAANVRARGHDRVSARPFDDQWAWVMMVRKTDGAWLHAGNASSRRQ
jgi:ketosteroid isomerase-like protein